ncbi:virulence-associated protein E, partial [Methylobacterium sp. WL122]
MQRRAKRREAEEREAAEVATRQRRALAIWEAATDPRGTIVADYLHSRRLELPDEVAGAVLRFHPRCPWENGTAPAMVAALRCILTNTLTGIHRTALTAEGRKVGRKMLGTAAGAAIKLDPDENVTLGLAIGEGIETCLTARQLGIRPTWALGSVDAVRGFPVLSGVEGLTVLGETGDAGAS